MTKKPNTKKILVDPTMAAIVARASRESIDSFRAFQRIWLEICRNAGMSPKDTTAGCVDFMTYLATRMVFTACQVKPETLTNEILEPIVRETQLVMMGMISDAIGELNRAKAEGN